MVTSNSLVVDGDSNNGVVSDGLVVDGDNNGLVVDRDGVMSDDLVVLRDNNGLVDGVVDRDDLMDDGLVMRHDLVDDGLVMNNALVMERSVADNGDVMSLMLRRVMVSALLSLVFLSFVVSVFVTVVLSVLSPKRLFLVSVIEVTVSVSMVAVLLAFFMATMTVQNLGIFVMGSAVIGSVALVGGGVLGVVVVSGVVGVLVVGGLVDDSGSD